MLRLPNDGSLLYRKKFAFSICLLILKVGLLSMWTIILLKILFALMQEGSDHAAEYGVIFLAPLIIMFVSLGTLFIIRKLTKSRLPNYLYFGINAVIIFTLVMVLPVPTLQDVSTAWSNLIFAYLIIPSACYGFYLSIVKSWKQTASRFNELITFIKSTQTQKI